MHHNRTGHQDSFRRMTKRDRAAFGAEHVPIYVAPPSNKCEQCKCDTVLRYYSVKRGWCCETCHNLPTICTTRASDCHNAFMHNTPLDRPEWTIRKPQPEPQKPPQTAREHMESWTVARLAGEAKRGDMRPVYKGVAS